MFSLLLWRVWGEGQYHVGSGYEDIVCGGVGVGQTHLRTSILWMLFGHTKSDTMARE